MSSQASDAEIVWVIRGAIVVIGTMACVIALTASSVYGLFVLCVDIVFVTLSPQVSSNFFCILKYQISCRVVRTLLFSSSNLVLIQRRGVLIRFRILSSANLQK